MPFVHIYHWMSERGGYGHLGMVVETPTGLRTYITMLYGEDPRNVFHEVRGVAPSLPQELRNMTGIRRLWGGIRDHQERRQVPGFQLRPGQRVVMPPHVGQDPDIHAAVAPVGRRVSIRQAGAGGPANGPRMSLVLAGGQIYKEPTEMIELPALTADQLGIDTQKIFHWWKSYAGRVTRQATKPFQTKELRNRYKACSTHLNCCGTVYLALRVGGATYFKGRSFNRFYARPDGVLKWAKEVRTAIEEVNRAGTTTLARYQAKRAEFERKVGRGQQRDPNDLPTLEEWKAISYVGVLARRKDQIAEIDRELGVYHRHTWDVEGGGEQKARALSQIMRFAEEHARLKPTSDRSHAVSYLIAKAWEVLGHRLEANHEDREFQNQQVDERSMYKSLAFTDAEYHEIFMGDEWIVSRDALDYKEVMVEETRQEWFDHGIPEHRQPVARPGAVVESDSDDD